MATKADEIYDQMTTLMGEGLTRADAFSKIALDRNRPIDSIRGAFYAAKKKREGGEAKPRSRRRETTPEDAIADARASFERSLSAIDREVEVADERAKEAVAEAKALKESAAERKAAIQERLEALT